MKKTARIRRRKIRPANTERLAKGVADAVSAYVRVHGWTIGTAGPYEIRMGAPGGDDSGWTLAPYEFVVKFYGCRRVDPPVPTVNTK